MQVAMAVAEEIENNAWRGYHDFGIWRERHEEVRPVLLSLQGTTFRFEGGTVVKVNMVDLSKFQESWRTPKMEEWVVTQITVRYYPVDSTSREMVLRGRRSGQKVEEIWGHDELMALKKVRPWHHPHVRDIASVKGRVCVFWDNASQDGYISVDPDHNNEGHYTVSTQVAYSRFVEGDLERAEKEANEILASYYEKVNPSA